VDVEGVEFMKKAMPVMEKVEFAPFSRCAFCWAPQSVCHSWEEDGRRGRGMFRRRRGGSCQYPGVLKEAVAATLAFVGDESEEWIQLEQRKRGVTEGDAE